LNQLKRLDGIGGNYKISINLLIKGNHVGEKYFLIQEEKNSTIPIVVYPDFENTFYARHALLLCSSYERWTGRQLIPGYQQMNNLIYALFDAPFVIVSHGIETESIFNFGNRAALELFEFAWEDFIRLPSQESADQENRADRKQLMARVKQDGYADDCSGVRISSTGKRFLITGATVWNVVDQDNIYHGQAAMFTDWTCL
jgi:hypothetical protein